MKPETTKTKRFLKVPHDLAKRTDLYPAAKLVAAALMNHGREKNQIFPSQERIREETGLSVSAIRRSIRELEAAGQFQVKSREKGRCSQYLPSPEIAEQYGYLGETVEMTPTPEWTDKIRGRSPGNKRVSPVKVTGQNGDLTGQSERSRPVRVSAQDGLTGQSDRLTEADSKRRNRTEEVSDVTNSVSNGSANGVAVGSDVGDACSATADGSIQSRRVTGQSDRSKARIGFADWKTLPYTGGNRCFYPLQEWGVDRAAASRLCELPEDRVLRQLVWLPYRSAANPAALLIKSIEHSDSGYDQPSGMTAGEIDQAEAAFAGREYPMPPREGTPSNEDSKHKAVTKGHLSGI